MDLRVVARTLRVLVPGAALGLFLVLTLLRLLLFLFGRIWLLVHRAYCG